MTCLTAQQITVIREAHKKLDIADYFISQGVTDVDRLRANIDFVIETQRINPSFDFRSVRMSGEIVEMG